MSERGWLDGRRYAAVPGSSIEQAMAAAGHAAMYGFLVFMPTTGFIMGYYGENGSFHQGQPDVHSHSFGPFVLSLVHSFGPIVHSSTLTPHS